MGDTPMSRGELKALIAKVSEANGSLSQLLTYTSETLGVVIVGVRMLRRELGDDTMPELFVGGPDAIGLLHRACDETHEVLAELKV